MYRSYFRPHLQNSDCIQTESGSDDSVLSVSLPQATETSYHSHHQHLVSLLRGQRDPVMRCEASCDDYDKLKLQPLDSQLITLATSAVCQVQDEDCVVLTDMSSCNVPDTADIVEVTVGHTITTEQGTICFISMIMRLNVKDTVITIV